VIRNSRNRFSRRSASAYCEPNRRQSDSRHRVGWSDRRISRFFVLRGLLLIALQLLVEDPAWAIGIFSGKTLTTPPPGGGEMVYFHFGVLYGLGASMVISSILLRFGTAIIGSVGVVAIFAAWVLIPRADHAGVLYPPWVRLLLIPGQTGTWQVFYPLIPWLGLTGLGLVFGRLLQADRSRAYRSVTVSRYAAPSMNAHLAVTPQSSFGIELNA
jgi:uncharacterized membrane protein